MGKNLMKRKKDGTIVGLPIGEKPMAKSIGVKFPVEIDEKLRSMESRSNFIREAVKEKLEKEGKL